MSERPRFKSPRELDPFRPHKPPEHEDGERPKLIEAHICLECGAVWDQPTNCPFNGADTPTVPVEELAVRLREVEESIEHHRDEIDAATLYGWKRDRDDIDNDLYRALSPPEERCGGKGYIDREVEGRALPVADDCPGCPDCSPQEERDPIIASGKGYTREDLKRGTSSPQEG